MATFSINAISYASANDFSDAEGYGFVDLYFTIADAATISYEYLSGAPGGINLDPNNDDAANQIEVTLGAEILSARIDAPDSAAFPLSDHPLDLSVTEFYVYDLLWDGGTKRTTVGLVSEFYEFFPSPPDTEIYFKLGGEDLPNLPTLNDFRGFILSNIFNIYTTPNTGPAGTGQAIPLSSFSSFATDEDEVVDSTGLGRTISTGLGDDTIAGLQGADIIDGGDGFDTLRYDLDADADGTNGIIANLAGTVGIVIDGFGEADQVTNIEHVIGTVAADTMIAGTTDVEFDGGDGDDTFLAGSGDTHFDGGDSFDTISFITDATGIIVDHARGVAKAADGGRDTFENVERVIGSEGDDYILAREGNFLWLEGDDGNDVLKFKNAVSGDLYGGAGNDKLIGGGSLDSLNGEDGDDIIYGNGGDDSILAGDGQNYAYGGSGHDDLFGGRDRDFLRGNTGNDTLEGEAGDDDLEGGHGNDTLDGDSGNDILEGGLGADDLTGGSGNDYYYGGAQDDVFRFYMRGNVEYDRIQDFEDGGDRIFLIGYGFDDISDFSIQTRPGNRSVIDLGTGQKIYVAGIEATDFSNSDFLFFG